MATEAVRQFAVMKLSQICAELSGTVADDKQFPNWWKIEDTQGFGIAVHEGELNFRVFVQVSEVDLNAADRDPGTNAFPMVEGNFLMTLVATFLSAPVHKQGYLIEPAPVGGIIQLDFPIYAEDEKQLQLSVLETIREESENILCRILQ